MHHNKPLPIGIDDFEKVRRNGYYYIDKSLMIKEFLDMRDEVALIARPRRFGKTLNMTMLREFFDITKDSRDIFEGLSIMRVSHREQMNSRPVIFLTFKDCKARDEDELRLLLKQELYKEYLRYEKLVRDHWPEDSYESKDFYITFETLRSEAVPLVRLVPTLRDLTVTAKKLYGVSPVLLIDEYDQPIMSSYEYGYHEEVSGFFSNFYGAAMKGNAALGQALLTGVQRVAKESIFSQFNNPQVYTVMDLEYAAYFGLDGQETEALLKDYGLELTSQVQRMYDGYLAGGISMYNPWSVLNYAKRGVLEPYWLKTSANFLVKAALAKADRNFWKKFDLLVMQEETEVWLTLDTSYAERDGNYSLWGLLVNAGYLTVTKRCSIETANVKIPNDEVMSEFQLLVSEMAGIESMDLRQMFDALMRKDMESFFSLYREIVISCTSYMDARENAYHMLFLGMCISLRGAYKVTSNLEMGYGRSDIALIALKQGYPHIIVEFKEGEAVEYLKEKALRQIIDNQYYASLTGEIICVGLAHHGKKCGIAFQAMEL